MRLLDTKILELREFFGDGLPPYAILSHTLGEGEIPSRKWKSGDAEAKVRI
jgi:hypothetical protein